MDVKARHFCEITSLAELKEALSEAEYEKHLFIGGGSNLLLTKDYEGLVILNRIKGMMVEYEDEEQVLINVFSGENWHEFVMKCVTNNWGGVENLSLIPGTVGAAPMQNIGAYGVEITDVFERLEALNLETFELETFNRNDCQFGYRESVFKRKLAGKYFIFSVTFRLTKKHKLNIEYGDIKQTLTENGIKISEAGIADVSKAVIHIRQSKLPDPAVLGNSGSFFKNPTIGSDQFVSLKQKFPEIKGFENANGVKVPAGWLIEQCGWKGKRVGETGSHARQALVLVNYGNAKGEEVYRLAKDIIQSVKDKFGIDLEPEVNVI